MPDFSVGTILSRSFSTFFKHPFVFIGLSILAQTPIVVTLLLVLNSTLEFWSLLIIGTTLTIFMQVFIQGATFIGVYEVFRGNSARFGKALSHMIRTLPATSGAFLAFIFITMIAVPGIFLDEGHTVAHILANTMVVIAMCLFLKLCLIIPICVAERLGPIETIRRAAELTKDFLWKIVCIYLVVGTIGVVFIWGIHFALMFFMDEFNTIIFGYFFRSIPMAFINIATAVIYFELRSAKEGISIENLAHVFD